MTPELSMRPHNGSAPGGSAPIGLASPEGGVGEFQAILEHAPRDTDRTSRTGGNRPSAPDSRTERESPPNLSKITAGVEDGALRDLPEWLRVALSSNHADSAAEFSEITADIGTAAAPAKPPPDPAGLPATAPDHIPSSSNQTASRLDGRGVNWPEPTPPVDAMRRLPTAHPVSSDRTAVISDAQGIRPNVAGPPQGKVIGPMEPPSDATVRSDQRPGAPILNDRAHTKRPSPDLDMPGSVSRSATPDDMRPVQDVPRRIEVSPAPVTSALKPAFDPIRPGTTAFPEASSVKIDMSRIQSAAPTPAQGFSAPPFDAPTAPTAPTVSLSAIEAAAVSIPATAPVTPVDLRAVPPVALTQLPEALSAQVKAFGSGAPTPGTLRAADGTLSTEMELAPADLGRLRVSLQTTERGLHLAITVERPESLLAVRQHLDTFHRSLITDGVTLDSIDIGTGDRSGGFERHAPRAPERRGTGARQDASPDTDVSISHDTPGRRTEPGRLDLSF